MQLKSHRGRDADVADDIARSSNIAPELDISTLTLNARIVILNSLSASVRSSVSRIYSHHIALYSSAIAGCRNQFHVLSS